jgi:hypothetical protein
MRRTIAALIAGLVLGITGTAVAAGGYWAEGGSGYKCEGITSGVSCNSGLYQVGITRDYVYVQKRRTKETFGCGKYDRWVSCVSD